MQVSVHSDLYKAGVTEDGQDYTAECYYVVAEDAQGHRWAHHATFKGCNAYYHHDEDGGGYVFEDIREQAKAQAEALCKKIEAFLDFGGDLDLTHWHQMPHAYGSQAYQNEGGDEEMVAWERGHEGMQYFGGWL